MKTYNQKWIEASNPLDAARWDKAASRPWFDIWRCNLLLTILFVVLAAVFPRKAGLAEAQMLTLPAAPHPGFWMANGPVYAIAPAGNRIYIGGKFDYVGPFTGHAAPLDAISGLPLASFPEIDGDVNTIAADGSGGWYIGGNFRWVGELARNNIAHILSDYSVDVNWNPDADSFVYALAVSGNVVYAGGDFTHIGGQNRNRIAALNTSNGQAAAWNPNASSSVKTLLVSGNAVYVGGAFNNIGGQNRD